MTNEADMENVFNQDDRSYRRHLLNLGRTTRSHVTYQPLCRPGKCTSFQLLQVFLTNLSPHPQQDYILPLSPAAPAAPMAPTIPTNNTRWWSKLLETPCCLSNRSALSASVICLLQRTSRMMKLLHRAHLQIKFIGTDNRR